MRTVGPLDRDVAKLAAAVALLAQGRSNAIGTVTLTAAATTTTVTSTVLSGDARILLTPTTANAAAALATTYVSANADGSFTLTHANNAQVDRTFRWAAIGG